MELMISIVVLMVLLSATAASLGVFSPRASRADLHDATASLLDQLEFARMRAMMTNHAVQFQVDSTSEPQIVTILDHGGRRCVGSTVANRIVPFSSTAAADTSGENARFANVAIVATIPSPFAICFRPDGRVVLPSTNLPIDPPSGETDLAAGEAEISMRMRVEMTGDNAVTHHVVIPYNGLAKVRYETP